MSVASNPPSSPNGNKPCARFLDIPKEIRTQVYNILLPPPGRILVDIHDRSHTKVRRSYAPGAGLLLACRLIHLEVAAMFATSTTTLVILTRTNSQLYGTNVVKELSEKVVPSRYLQQIEELVSLNPDFSQVLADSLIQQLPQLRAIILETHHGAAVTCRQVGTYLRSNERDEELVDMAQLRSSLDMTPRFLQFKRIRPSLRVERKLVLGIREPSRFSPADSGEHDPKACGCGVDPAANTLVVMFDMTMWTIVKKTRYSEPYKTYVNAVESCTGLS